MEPIVNYTLIINEITLVNHHINGQSFKINPQIQRKINILDESHAAVTYILEIRNTTEQPFPFDITVSLTGQFDLSKLAKENIDEFLKIQTCQILFPQIRTIVASLTTSALMPPILLPIVDAKTLFDEK